MQHIVFDGNQLPFDQDDLGQFISKVLSQNAPLKGKLFAWKSHDALLLNECHQFLQYFILK